MSSTKFLRLSQLSLVTSALLSGHAFAEQQKEEQAIEKLRSDINHIKKITKKTSAKVYVYVLPNELKVYQGLEGVKVFSVADKDKYDPENKSKKVKPNRPGIYLE